MQTSRSNNPKIAEEPFLDSPDLRAGATAFTATDTVELLGNITQARAILEAADNAALHSAVTVHV